MIAVKNKINKKNLFACLALLGGNLFLFLTIWLLSKYDQIHLDQILYQMKSPASGAHKDLLSSAFLRVGVFGFALTAAEILLYLLLSGKWRQKKQSSVRYAAYCAGKLCRLRHTLFGGLCYTLYVGCKQQPIILPPSCGVPSFSNFLSTGIFSQSKIPFYSTIHSNKEVSMKRSEKIEYVQKFLKESVEKGFPYPFQVLTEDGFFLFRLKNGKHECCARLRQTERSLRDLGFHARLASRQDVMRLLAVYYQQDVTTEQFDAFDGERWISSNG